MLVYPFASSFASSCYTVLFWKLLVPCFYTTASILHLQSFLKKERTFYTKQGSLLSILKNPLYTRSGWKLNLFCAVEGNPLCSVSSREICQFWNHKRCRTWKTFQKPNIDAEERHFGICKCQFNICVITGILPGFSSDS